MNRISRRSFLKSLSFIGLSAACGLGTASCTGKGGETGKQLFVYNWPYYISDKVIPEFEKEFSVKVTYDNYSSNEELLAKFQAGATGYDLIFPSDYMFTMMINQNLLETLDHSRIPNIKNLDERFKGLDCDPKNTYSLPYFWGTSGIGVNTEKVKEKVDS